MQLEAFEIALVVGFVWWRMWGACRGVMRARWFPSVWGVVLCNYGNLRVFQKLARVLQ